MNKRVILGLGFSLATAVAAHAETTVRIAHATPESSPIHQALVYFQDQIQERSDGEMTVELFPGGQLGSVKEVTELVQSGNISMTTGASVLLSATVDELAVLDQFLLFEDEEQARTLLDGEAGDAISEAMEKRGLKNMGFMELGFRSFTNSRAPLDSFESFEGLRMRSADNPIAIKAWRSVGAVPLPLAWGEIYSSLQQGLIDGQESALSSMVIERFFEVQDYVSLTGHIYWPELWMADLNWFEGLTEDEQALLMEVAAETVDKQRELTAKANAETLDRLKEEGLAINELPAEDKKKLGDTMNGASEADIRAKVGDDFYDTFMAAISK
ncbi:TRAP transporter substrate-binding protein [Primorskyibacter flagellatus]|uniref:Tripartite ATP-independent transporter solute receptor, DctP family n=1 Tax=Primorskyibacter flagellatus TaxID=1387277 RepID=A0A1W2D9T6_9RHOB|nr:TRAP transporter substrate-binding protein [Primorskyibacter flagellatus]SMC94215.1 tripartite ATP-independent transporter solute receptor, DctP family [Primorskyibacter flagellatus]